jgi:predicted O-methyltransferase YrrM
MNLKRSAKRLKLNVKDRLKKQLANVFHLGQRFGVDILPRHFYSEIPAIEKLRTKEVWRAPYSMIGVEGWDADDQLRFVQAAMNDDARSALANQDVFKAACTANAAIGYSPIDAEFLYAFVRHHKPPRITQIGCGISTAVCLNASHDAGYSPQITCIEPYPNQFLIAQELARKITLIRSPVEELELDFLQSLVASDFFFVDSTHTLGPAGEVTRIILEMLPRLAAGVLIHFHDIFLPYDFDPRIMDRIFFWHETSLLHALLCGNERFRVLASLSLLHHERQAELAQLFTRYEPMQIERGVRTRHGHYPNSMYLQVTAPPLSRSR